MKFYELFLKFSLFCIIFNFNLVKNISLQNQTNCREPFDIGNIPRTRTLISPAGGAGNCSQSLILKLLFVKVLNKGFRIRVSLFFEHSKWFVLLRDRSHRRLIAMDSTEKYSTI